MGWDQHSKENSKLPISTATIASAKSPSTNIQKKIASLYGKVDELVLSIVYLKQNSKENSKTLCTGVSSLAAVVSPNKIQKKRK